MKISILAIIICTLLLTLVACSIPPTQESEQTSVLQSAHPIETEKKAPQKAETTSPSPDLIETETVLPETDSSFVQETEKETVTEKEEMVWVTTSGKKYHSNPNCSNMKSPFQIPLKEAQEKRDPCSKCY